MDAKNHVFNLCTRTVSHSAYGCWDGDDPLEGCPVNGTHHKASLVRVACAEDPCGVYGADEKIDAKEGVGFVVFTLYEGDAYWIPPGWAHSFKAMPVPPTLQRGKDYHPILPEFLKTVVRVFTYGKDHASAKPSTVAQVMKAGKMQDGGQMNVMLPFDPQAPHWEALEDTFVGAILPKRNSKAFKCMANGVVSEIHLANNGLQMEREDEDM
ncbi:hypothetical protein CYMTET_28235 [Cymbomonas tetramitiformis]|uniref:Uncharacterized protein n=1 Tax=Cymbomonas tetramitiformis TaxID=36881 RepID=A0AAE0KW45_9CHLO|nr:hypothetical protein CYMTET_28235 [Cymbomonas tetramitiformis]